MTKRSDIRQHYQTEANQAAHNQQFQDRTAQLNALEDTVINAFNTLIRFIDGKTTKTEVVNQLKSISTPDVDKVVTAISKLDKDILANKLDIKPLEQGLNSLKRELSLIPKSLPKIPEQKDTIKVTNLNEVKLDTSQIEKAIKDLKLDPTIDVKAPVVNVDAPNLKPLQDLMLDLLKATQSIKLDVPETDLSKLEKQSTEANKKLDEANKHLKKISEKPTGGGGGGGNGTSYQNTDGNLVYVELTPSGAVPVDISDDTVSSSTDVSLASSATSAQVVAANTSRKGLLLNNTDTNTAYLYYGTTATTSKFSVAIPSGGYWEMPKPTYTGRIDAIWAADGSGSLIGSEL